MADRMAEVRCPMCGKPNPEELEVCQFCEARLKPLIGPFEPADAQQEKPRKHGGVTDWLDSLREQEEGGPGETAPEESGEAEIEAEVALTSEDLYTELPGEADWLAGLQPDRVVAEEAEAEPAAALEAEESGESGGLEPAVEQGDTGAEIFSFEEEAPSQLEPAPGDEQLPVEPKEEMPDWLKGFIESEPAGEPASPLEAAQPGESEAGQMPDWLAELEETAGLEISSDALEEKTGLDEIAEETQQFEPDDFEAETEAPSTPEKLPAVAPFTFDEEEQISQEASEMPEWLAEAPALETADEAPELEESEAGLSRAELPGWLEAMRPVEAAAPIAPFLEEGDLEVESRGPLAGLRGVLPIEPEITQLKKPSAYALKLQVSDSQRKHASLFEELISNEGVTAPVEAGPAISPQNVLRVVVFLLLLIAAGWPIYTGSQNINLPTAAREVEQASQLINQVTVSEPILLAVDYEPGFSGEMDAAAASILDHLMIRGAYLAVVSTSPTGPAQAERLIQSVNTRAGHTYQAGSQYANLGYVPGGPAGLLSFAQAPRQITPFGMASEPVWERGPLANIQTLADFAKIVIITESPETARAWIEQVQPTLLNSEILLVVSAQAEPLVRPYYEGYPQQVKALVTGLAGGAAYESGLPRALFARQYWNAFSYGLVLAVLFILAGSVLFSISGIVSRRKSAFKEKK